MRVVKCVLPPIFIEYSGDLVMGQLGFFDLEDRLEQLSKHGDPLVKLNEWIPWNDFRTLLRKALHKTRKSAAGRKPFEPLLMFKIIVIQHLYNLADGQTEYQIRDRLSFMRFLGLQLEDTVPDEKTIWLFRERLIESKVLDKLFVRFEKHLVSQGFDAKAGQIVDASIVQVPRQRNSRDENAEIKKGETPEDWKEDSNKLRQKDVDARWTKKNNQNYYGYKNHINVDAEHKLIRKFKITAASHADGNYLEELLDENNPAKKIWGDMAYYSQDHEEMLKAKKYESRIHHKKTISPNQERWHYRYSKIRVRVEHVFGFISNTMKGSFIRTIGLTPASFKIGMNNLVYNFSRFKQLQAGSA